MMGNKNCKNLVNVVLIIILLAISLFLSYYFTNKDANRDEPLCINGNIDLSNWNFDKNGNVKLNGEWQFYPNELLSPKDFDNKLFQNKLFIKVPNSWKNQIDKNIISDRGIGTYRLRVKTNSSINMYALKTTNIRSSNKIFINGKEVSKSGNPKATIKEGYITNIVPTITFFPNETNELDIIIQVANIDYYNGGIIQTIYLGSEKNILGYSFKCDILDIMLVSFLLLNGIYYFAIYIKKMEDKRLMYFATSCVINAYIDATGNQKIFNRIFSTIPFMSILRVKMAAISLSIIFISLFIREMNKKFIPKKFMSMIKSIMVINIVLILSVPIKIIYLMENVIGLIDILIYISISISILRGIILEKHKKSNKKSEILLFTAVITIILYFISNSLYFYSVITTNILPIITTIIFLATIAAMLSNEYETAYHELEIMSDNLIAVNKTKDEFLINTSHEFKTPLHAIINITESILNNHEGRINEKQQKNLLYIMSIATRLSGLVNDIIDFENLQNRSMKVKLKVFDINGVIHSNVEILKHLRKSEDIKIINSVPSEMYYVYSDENRFKQIIINLIGNSLKYTEKGYIEIKAYNKEEFIYISVQDTGIGISEAHQEKLFKENIYNDKNNFTDYASSGLGLSIAKLLAEHMGGDLYLEWSKMNKGSMFTLKIPKANEDKMKEINIRNFNKKNNGILSRRHKLFYDISNVNEHKIVTNINKNKILIVDDEVSNIKVLQEILDEKFYDIKVAYNGKMALDIIDKNTDISLVLLDVMMPGLSGYEVCRKIRQDYKIYEVPILLLTVRNTAEDVAMGLEAGANDFMSKPFNAEELKARIKTLEKMRESVQDAIKMESIFLQAQIKPHFLYNALSVIMALCYIDGEKAGNLLGELSNYLRGTLDIDPHNSLITLKKEISIVKSYVELEKARFGDRLKVDFNIDERYFKYKIPALIIQPIVENSIRHGLMKRLSGGIVKISVEKISNKLKIVVEDNGVGMEQDKLKNLFSYDNSSSSVGLKNVNKRLINEYGQGLAIESKEGEGTINIIYIPILAT